MYDYISNAPMLREPVYNVLYSPHPLLGAQATIYSRKKQKQAGAPSGIPPQGTCGGKS